MGRNRRSFRKFVNSKKKKLNLSFLKWKRAEDESNPFMSKRIPDLNPIKKPVEVSSSSDVRIETDDLPEPYVPTMVTSSLSQIPIEEPGKPVSIYRYQDKEYYPADSNLKADASVDRVARTFVYKALSDNELQEENRSHDSGERQCPQYTYSSYKDLETKTIEMTTNSRGSKYAALEWNPPTVEFVKHSAPKSPEGVYKDVAILHPTTANQVVDLIISDGDDDVIVLDTLDLEEGEIRSDMEETPVKKKKKRVSRKLRRSPRHKTPVEMPVTEITLDDITLDDRLDDDDGDCQVIAILPTPNPLKAMQQKQFTPNRSKKREQFRGRSVVRIPVKPLGKRMHTPKKDAQKDLNKPSIGAQSTGIVNPVLKRLKKSRWGTPLPLPIRHGRYFANKFQNRNPAQNGYVRGIHNNTEENESRTGKSRRRPLIPHSETAQFHRNSQFPRANSNLPVQASVNDLSSNFQPRVLGKPRPIIIDGSNVAIAHGLRKRFSCRGLQICINHIKEILPHSEIICFVPRFRQKASESTDTHILRGLEDDGIVVLTPSREVNGKHITSYDDRFILEYAADSGGIVISNDNYKDLFDSEPKWRDTITNRLLQFTWVKDRLMIPTDPLGKYGPTLEEFCSFSFDQ